ncbi:MAG: head decoration protein [Pseudomonadota bacterium]
MPFVTEPDYPGDLIKYEADRHYSRDEGLIASGAGALGVGAVLGVVTGSGEYAPVDPSETNGLEVAAALLLQTVDATSAAAPAVVLTRHAVVSRAALVYGAAVTTPAERQAIDEQLTAAGLVVRDAA